MHISEALSLFLEACEAHGLAAKTLRFYSDNVRRFADSLPAARQTLGAWTTSDVNHFLAGERKRGLAEASVHGCYRALNRFFNWCEDSEELGAPRSPMRNQRGKRVIQVRKPAYVEARSADIKVVDALIASLPRHNWIQRRNRVALRLMRDTGLRLGEAANIKLDDLNLAGRLLTIPKSKGRKTRKVRFTHVLVDEVETYLASRPPCPPELAVYLFVSAINDNPDQGVRGKLSEEGLRQMLIKLCERTELPHTNPHSIRHMFGTKALNEGIRLETVSDLMGHHDPSFTRRVYAKLLDETKQREYDEHWT